MKQALTSGDESQAQVVQHDAYVQGVRSRWLIVCDR